MGNVFKSEQHMANFIRKIIKDSPDVDVDKCLPVDFYISYIYGRDLEYLFKRDVCSNPTLLEEDSITFFLQNGRFAAYTPERISHLFTEQMNEIIPTLNGMPGVYSFWTKSKKPLYVGTSKNLADRMPSSFHERFTSFDKPVFLRYAVTQTASDACVLEMYFIAKLKPALNGAGKYSDPLTLNVDAPALTKPIQVNRVGRKMQRNGVYYISESKNIKGCAA